MENLELSLSTLRKNLGMTQQDVADKLDVSLKTVIKWENGEKINALVIYALAKLYRVEVDNIKVPS